MKDSCVPTVLKVETASIGTFTRSPRLVPRGAIKSQTRRHLQAVCKGCGPSDCFELLSPNHLSKHGSVRTALLWLQGPRAVRSPLRACNAERRERVKLFGRGAVSATAFLGHIRVPYMYRHCSYMTGLGVLSKWRIMLFSSQRTGDAAVPGPSLTVATCQRTQVSSSASRELSS